MGEKSGDKIRCKKRKFCILGGLLDKKQEKKVILIFLLGIPPSRNMILSFFYFLCEKGQNRSKIGGGPKKFLFMPVEMSNLTIIKPF